MIYCVTLVDLDTLLSVSVGAVLTGLHVPPPTHLQLFWAYIHAMLTNLDSMPLERIHSMLRMFVATGPVVTEMDVNELEAFLQRKVREHQLIMSAGVYRLPKSN